VFDKLEKNANEVISVARQEKQVHVGCYSACQSGHLRCVLDCESAMYSCMGSDSTEGVTNACQAKVFQKLGVKDSKSLLQVKRNIDDDNAEAAEMAHLEDQSDKDMGEDDDDAVKSPENTAGSAESDDSESFVQLKRKEDNKAMSVARQERQVHVGCYSACKSGRLTCVLECEHAMYSCMGSDSTEGVTHACQTKVFQKLWGKNPKSFLQVRRNIDDDNAEAAEMARLEDQSDKDMGEDDDDSAKAAHDETNSEQPDDE